MDYLCRISSRIKMADKLALINKEEVNYTVKTSSYSISSFNIHPFHTNKRFMDIMQDKHKSKILMGRQP